MDGYTYMIERNKLLIRQARERSSQPPKPAPGGAEQQLLAEAREREQLMDLYSCLEGCGRTVQLDGKQQRGD